MGTRSSAPDPQRARSTGSRRGRRNTFRHSDLQSDDVDQAEGRWVDPVVARPESGPPDTETAASRSSAYRDPPGGTVEQAKEVCLRLLAVRARSRAELAGRLAAKGYSPDVSERALDRLTEVGLVDDAAFAEQWVHSRHTFSGKGKQALAQELRRKGVAQSDAASALAGITVDDEESRAAELVRRKMRSLPRDLDRDKAIRRLVGMLARRGYGQSTAYRVVKAALTDDGVESDPIDPID